MRYDVTTLVPDHTTTSRLAVHRLAPSPSWATVGTNDDIPMMPRPRVNDPSVAARNRGARSSAGSTSGCGTRRSTKPKPTAARAASTPRTTVGPSMPLRPWVSAETSSVIAATSRTRPGTSIRRGSVADDSPIRTRLGHSRSSATTPTTAYDSRQPDPKSRAAARIAPAVMPRPTLAPQMEVACTRAGPGAKSWASTARPQANTAAPPTPSTTRAATNSTGSCDTAQTRAPTPMAPRPPAYTRRRP